MDIAEFLIRKPSAVHRRGDIHVAGKELRVAPTASAAAAVGRRVEPGRFHSAEQGGVCVAGDLGGLARDGDGQGKLILDVAGVIGALFGMEELTEQLVTHKLAADAQLFDLLIRKVVHRLRAAHKDGVVALGRVLLDEVGGDEAAFAALLLFIGKHIDKLDLVALFCPSVELVAEDGVRVGAAAVQKHQRAGFVTFVDRLCQSAEGGDAAAASDTDHGVGVTKPLVSEVAEGCRNGHFLPDLPVVQNKLRNDTAAHSLDGDHIKAVQGIGGGRRDGIGALEDLAVDIGANAEVLTRGEPSEGRSALVGVCREYDALHVGGELMDLFDHEVLRLGVQLRRELVGIVVEKVFCGGVGSLADGADPLGDHADHLDAG